VGQHRWGIFPLLAHILDSLCLILERGSLSSSQSFQRKDLGQYRKNSFSVLAYILDSLCLILEPVTPSSSQSFQEKALGQNRFNCLGRWGFWEYDLEGWRLEAESD
jgi:hypothetical protein